MSSLEGLFVNRAAVIGAVRGGKMASRRLIVLLGLASAGQGAVPMSVTTIPDQTDYIETQAGSGPQPPQAVGTIPDQTDELAA